MVDWSAAIQPDRLVTTWVPRPRGAGRCTRPGNTVPVDFCKATYRQKSRPMECRKRERRRLASADGEYHRA